MIGAAPYTTSRRIFFNEEDATADLVSLLAEARLNEANDSFDAESPNSSADRKENLHHTSGKQSFPSAVSSKTTSLPKKTSLGGAVRRVERPSETPLRERHSILSRSSLTLNTNEDSRISSGSDLKAPRRLIQTSFLSGGTAFSPIAKETRPSTASTARSPPISTPSRAAQVGWSPKASALSPSNSFVDSESFLSCSEPKDQLDYLVVIGKGNFGKVLLARREGFDDVVAVKVLDRKRLLERGNLRRAHCEIRCLERCSSKFIVKLEHAYETKSNIFIVQEFCMGGDLFSVLSRFGKLSATAVRFYSAQCALALQHLHDLRYAYRDLKTENIMLDRKGNVRLVDFGLVKEGVTASDRGGRSFVGTTEYLAPEMILRKGHGLAVDWWALGVVVYELLTGLPPWYVNNMLEMQRRVMHDPLNLSSSYLVDSAKLTVAALLEKNPAKRLGSKNGISAIRSSPFFVETDWPALAEMRVPAPFLPIVEHDADVRYFSDEFLTLPVEI
jgi:hypothetical protein